MLNVLRRPGTVGMLVGCLCTTIAFAAFASSANAHHRGNTWTTTVQTRDGTVIGITNDGMREFLGIPYAAPPVGALRWAPPQPVEPWSTPLHADRFANHCPQAASPFGEASTTEDCLYLNVFTPPVRGRYPVMVWIHGGAFVSGESNDYNPAPFVADGVIVVTINYRLGALGFLADPALASANGAAGDYGLMDQQAALEWVQDNIGRFGGDRHNVTLFGQSAGGLSVLSQLVNPASAAHHLFRKAIVESGSYSYAIGLPTLAEAEASGEQFAQRAGCTSADPAQVAACLRALPVATVLADTSVGLAGFVPNTGTSILPESIKAALANGSVYHVPVIEGTNRNEYRLFVALAYDLGQGAPLSAANYPAAVEALGIPSDAVSAVTTAEYPLSDYASPDLALAAVGTDFVFACSGRAEVQALSRYATTYTYEFNDPNAPELFLPPVSFPYESAHASELQYLFGPSFTPPAFPASLTPAQQQLASTMVGYWTRFAKTGNPTRFRSAAPAWPAYGYYHSRRFNSLQPPTPRILSERDFTREHHCHFWAPFYH